MPGRVVRAVAMCLAVVIAGCSRQADYPVALMVTDDGLVGVWTVDGEQSDTRLEVRARDVEVVKDRTVGAANPASGERAEKPTRAYTLRLLSDDQAPPIELSAVLIEIEGVRLVGVQLSDEELKRSPISGLMLPLHYLLRIEREGDTIRAWAPAHSLAWVPAAQWLDPPCGPPGDIARDPKRGIRLTSSIDRLIEVYRQEMKKPDFWSEEAATFSRAP